MRADGIHPRLPGRGEMGAAVPRGGDGAGAEMARLPDVAPRHGLNPVPDGGLCGRRNGWFEDGLCDDRDRRRGELRGHGGVDGSEIRRAAAAVSGDLHVFGGDGAGGGGAGGLVARFWEGFGTLDRRSS